MATRKPKSKYDFLGTEEFFMEVSKRCNYLDVKMVEQVYRELVRVTVQELRRKAMIRYPDFGDFTMVMHKERWSTDVNTKQRIRVPAKRTIKYEPDRKLKRFLQQL